MGSTRALASRAHARGRDHNLGRSRVEREVTTITPHLRSALEATGSAAQCTTPRRPSSPLATRLLDAVPAKFAELIFWRLASRSKRNTSYARRIDAAKRNSLAFCEAVQREAYRPEATLTTAPTAAPGCPFIIFVGFPFGG
jgi:hypothetical protein